MLNLLQTAQSVKFIPKESGAIRNSDIVKQNP